MIQPQKQAEPSAVRNDRLELLAQWLPPSLYMLLPTKNRHGRRKVARAKRTESKQGRKN